jgi:DNA polymerase (family 10)
MFNLLSKLMDIHQENSFKAKSYGAGAFAIEKLPVELESIPREKIAFLKGIGESSAKKIQEILDTGKLEALETLIRKTPAGVLEMLQIKGLGPKKISTIWKEMEIESIGELLYACNENRLMLYKGFGAKTQQNVAEAIEFYLRHQGHFLYAEIERYVARVQDILHTQFPASQLGICGAFARQEPTLESVSWVTDLESTPLVQFLTDNHFSVTEKNDDITIAHSEEGIKLQFHHVSHDSFSAELFRKTGSDAFVQRWLERFPESLIAPTNERDIFEAASIHPIPAFLRNQPDVIEKSSSAFFKDIIQPSDIVGIIHSHSNWSDGSNTIEEMARACIEQGFEYLVISDHSKTAFYANGLSEDRIKAQHQYIDELNEKLAPFKIFKSIESDILNDGSLDYTDALLGTFDLVIASVHSNLKMNEEKAMMRLIKAIENPYTTILGHPTGRLLLSRKGYPIDHEKIIAACIANKVAIEINAHPRRLDLDWTWVERAQEMGALLSINPDAHHVDGYRDIRYGVLAAQKGGLRKQNNLSSFSLQQFEQFLQQRRS